MKLRATKTITGLRVAAVRMSVTHDAVLVALVNDSGFNALDLAAKEVMENLGLGDMWSARMSYRQPYGVAIADVPGWESTGDEVLVFVPGLGEKVSDDDGWTHFMCSTADDFPFDMPYRADPRWLLDEADRIWQGVKLVKEYVDVVLGVHGEINRLQEAFATGDVSAFRELLHLRTILNSSVNLYRLQRYRRLSQLGLWPMPLESAVYTDSFLRNKGDFKP